MTKKLKVSVVIPTYNRLEYLERALASVMAQTYRNFEIIVVQNGRGRESQKVTEEFLGRGIAIRYFYLSVANAVHARNLGVRQAEGDYIAFLDDDDEWMPEKLEKQTAFFEANSGTGLLACHARVIKNGKPMKDERAVFPEERISFFHFVEKGCVIYSLSCVMIKKECFERVGMMNPEYHIANDYDFYFRVASRYAISIIREPLVVYYRHEKNAISDVKRTILENVRILKGLKQKCRESWTRREIKKAIEGQMDFYARFAYERASQGVSEKRYFEAAAYFFRAVRSNPFVGAKLKWGRYNHAFYRTLRPYAAIVFCMLLGIKQFFLGIFDGKRKETCAIS